MSGKDKGTVWLEFYSDFSLVGYGMSLYSPGFFVVTGTWTQDSKGTVFGWTDQVLYKDPNTPILPELLSTASGSFVGKARTGKSLQGKFTSAGGTVTMRGKPYFTSGYMPDNQFIYLQKFTSKMPGSVDLTPTMLPGIFSLSGRIKGPEGYYGAAHGAASLSSKGRLVIYIYCDLVYNSYDYISYHRGYREERYCVTGTYSFRSGRASLKGRSDFGAPVKGAFGW